MRKNYSQKEIKICKNENGKKIKFKRKQGLEELGLNKKFKTYLAEISQE